MLWRHFYYEQYLSSGWHHFTDSLPSSVWRDAALIRFSYHQSSGLIANYPHTSRGCHKSHTQNTFDIHQGTASAAGKVKNHVSYGLKGSTFCTQICTVFSYDIIRRFYYLGLSHQSIKWFYGAHQFPHTRHERAFWPIKKKKMALFLGLSLQILQFRNNNS